MAEMPELVQLQEEMKDEGLRVVAVSLDLHIPMTVETVEQLDTFLRDAGLEDLDVVAFEGDAEALYERFEAPGPLPYTFVLDRSGRIVEREEGPAGHSRFEAMARAALR